MIAPPRGAAEAAGRAGRSGSRGPTSRPQPRRWLAAGGSHHTVFTAALGLEAIADLAEIAGVELVSIDGRQSRAMHDELRTRVLAANLAIVDAGLVTLTFGNASGVDRAAGVMAIKPSGVPYDRLDAERDRARRPRERGGAGRRAAAVLGRTDASRALPELRRRRRRRAHALAVRDRLGAGRAATCRASARPTPTTSAGRCPSRARSTADEIGGAYEERTGDVIVEAIQATRPRPARRCRARSSSRTGRSPGAPRSRTRSRTPSRSRRSPRSPSGRSRSGPMPAELDAALHDRHFARKHGPSRYYGQP